MNLKKNLIPLFVLLIGVSFLFGGYTRWNSANPQQTCASCHEISSSVSGWQVSAHRNIQCSECHGTAISNGIHSLKEKAHMIFTHVNKNPEPENIHMTERQVLDLSERCTKCHQAEYKKWLSGGHSAKYADIFMNGKHNMDEPPYWGCLRCHGMFYDGNIQTLLKKPQKADGVWRLNDKMQATLPTMPCLTCHSMHINNDLLGNAIRFDIPVEISHERIHRHPSVSFYVRADKRSIRSDQLMAISMFSQNKTIRVSNDPISKLCQQCHSPNFKHQSGSEDDRTPTGVHEGIPCMACHMAHSNDARSSCKNCHPAISNCNVDVTTMNTTFVNLNSPNNIHSVSCGSCHTNVQELRARKHKKEQKK